VVASRAQQIHDDTGANNANNHSDYISPVSTIAHSISAPHLPVFGPTKTTFLSRESAWTPEWRRAWISRELYSNDEIWNVKRRFWNALVTFWHSLEVLPFVMPYLGKNDNSLWQRRIPPTLRYKSPHIVIRANNLQVDAHHHIIARLHSVGTLVLSNTSHLNCADLAHMSRKCQSGAEVRSMFEINISTYHLWGRGFDSRSNPSRLTWGTTSLRNCASELAERWDTGVESAWVQPIPHVIERATLSDSVGFTGAPVSSYIHFKNRPILSIELIMS
jgi:hypothetical protein